MRHLEPKDRVIARKLLRLMREGALVEERNFVEGFAKKLGLVLDPPTPTAAERDEARASNKRPGRTKGLRRGFAG